MLRRVARGGGDTPPPASGQQMGAGNWRWCGAGARSANAVRGSAANWLRVAVQSRVQYALYARVVSGARSGVGTNRGGSGIVQ